MQQAAPTETGPIVALSAAPSVSVVPESIASIEPSATASAATIDKEAARREALRQAAEVGMIGLLASDAGESAGHGTRLPGAHSVPPPSIRLGALTVNGRLPPEVIQRIVRQNFGRFRLCYESGLRANPSLQGRVSTRYVIGHDGSVTTTQDAGSDMADQNVVQCVVRAFGNLSYPQPEGGIVTVVCPLLFSPGS